MEVVIDIFVGKFVENIEDNFLLPIGTHALCTFMACNKISYGLRA